MVEKYGVGKFMVEKSGVEKSGVEKSWVEMFTQIMGLKLRVEKSGVEMSFNLFEVGITFCYTLPRYCLNFK